MRMIALLLSLTLTGTVSANAFSGGDAKAGQRLFEQYKCNSCHINMYGGDGSAIFTRPNSKVHNAAELIAQIGRCGGNVDKNFTAKEEQDIAAYLNRYYHLK